MARDARIIEDFGDGTYEFRLAWGELSKLQEACDAGPFVILHRIGEGAWRVEDLSHIIRLGLIGGGLEPVKALRLVRQYVEARPPAESVPLAYAVLSAGCVGAPDEPLGKAQAANPAESASTTSPTAS